MMRIKAAVAICALAVLAGCGGGGSDQTGTQSIHPFLLWSGSSSGDQVIDGNNDAFAFYADSGCLYNFQTGRENTAFCLVSSGNVVAYGPFRGQVLNVLSSTGVCVAAIIDAFTGNFADIEIDSFGREVVVITPLRPTICRS
jgi:hypothetical protein